MCHWGIVILTVVYVLFVLGILLGLLWQPIGPLRKRKILKQRFIIANLRERNRFYKDYIRILETRKTAPRLMIMPLVKNDGVLRFRIAAGLDADGKPGVFPDDAVLVWSVEPVNGGEFPPELIVDEDGLGCSVAFGPGKTGDQWKVQVTGKSEVIAEWQPFGETAPYEILPGIATAFVIEEVPAS